jgi:hypothetical protein
MYKSSATNVLWDKSILINYIKIADLDCYPHAQRVELVETANKRVLTGQHNRLFGHLEQPLLEQVKVLLHKQFSLNTKTVNQNPSNSFLFFCKIYIL